MWVSIRPEPDFRGDVRSINQIPGGVSTRGPSNRVCPPLRWRLETFERMLAYVIILFLRHQPRVPAARVETETGREGKKGCFLSGRLYNALKLFLTRAVKTSTRCLFGNLEKISLPNFQAFEFTVCIASVAQLVELLICNQWVGGSSPSAGSR